MSWFAEFHFLRPWWLLLLLLLVPLLWYLRVVVHNTRTWSHIFAPELLKHLVQDTHQAKRPPLWLLPCALVIVALSLAGPTWYKKSTITHVDAVPTIFLLDVSWSMNATDLEPTRLQHAIITVREWLAEQKANQYALIVFSGDAHVVAPLTFDTATLEHLLRSISPEIMPAFGSNVSLAMNKAFALVQQADILSVNIVLLTDGMTTKEAQKATEAIAHAKDTQEGLDVQLAVLGFGNQTAPVIRTDNGRFITLENGKPLHAPVEHQSSMLFARLAGGQFIAYTSVQNTIQQAEAFFSTRWQDMHKKTDIEFDVWQDMGYWLVFLLLPLTLTVFRRGWLVCLLLVPTIDTHASDWQQSWRSLWYTPDQQAMQAYQNKEYKRAENLFKRDDWRGAAAYQNKSYDAAAQLFAQDTSQTGQYNLATTFAQQGKIAQALALYDDLLYQPKLDATIAMRAKKNKELLERIQKERQQTQQQGDQQTQNENRQTEQQTQVQPERQQTQQNNDQKKNQNDNQQTQQETKTQQQEQADAQQQIREQTADSEESKSDQTPSLYRNITPMERQQLESLEHDIGTLLKRKFLLEYQRNQANNPQPNTADKVL